MTVHTPLPTLELHLDPECAAWRSVLHCPDGSRLTFDNLRDLVAYVLRESPAGAQNGGGGSDPPSRPTAG